MSELATLATAAARSARLSVLKNSRRALAVAVAEVANSDLALDRKNTMPGLVTATTLTDGLRQIILFLNKIL